MIKIEYPLKVRLYVTTYLNVLVNKQVKKVKKLQKSEIIK